MPSVTRKRRLLAGAFAGLLCAIAAFATSYFLPGRYISQATVQFSGSLWPGHSPDQLRWEIDDRWNELRGILLSRATLTAILQLPNVDLFGRERESVTDEDVAELMRPKVRLWAEDQATAIHLSFEAPDRYQAQVVANALVSKMLFANQLLEDQARKGGSLHMMISRAPDPSYVREGFLPPKTEIFSALPDPPEEPPAQSEVPDRMLSVIEPASLPEQSEGLGRWSIAAVALGAGFLLVQAAFFLVRAGRTAWRRPHYPWALLAGAAAGAAAACAAGITGPARYESSAVMRFHGSQPSISIEAVRERVLQIEQFVCSRGQLGATIRNPALNLYQNDVVRHPLEDVIAIMRRDLHFQPAEFGGALNAVRISFTYSDPQLAKQVVDQIVAKVMETNHVSERQGPTVLIAEVLAPARPAEWRPFPQSPENIAVGAVAGAGLALLFAFLLRGTRRQALMALAGAAAGAVAVAAFLLIPAPYSATATLRIRPDPSGRIPTAVLADFVRQQLVFLLGTEKLSAVSAKVNLAAVRQEQGHATLSNPVQRIRRDLSITAPPRETPSATFTIGFRAPTAVLASETVLAIVTPLLEASGRYMGGLENSPRLEILEEPLAVRLPPPAAPLLLSGPLAGLLLALAWARRPGSNLG